MWHCKTPLFAKIIRTRPLFTVRAGRRMDADVSKNIGGLSPTVHFLLEHIASAAGRMATSLALSRSY